MPGKKKKFNSRFPPARIKKIMQTDEEVGKVAAAVPVIISRGLELFVESLLTRAGEITSARHARTLTPAHLKQCIMADKRFDFLQELVASVTDISADGESDVGPPTPSTPLTPVINSAPLGVGLDMTPTHHVSPGNEHPLSPRNTGDVRGELKSSQSRRGRGRGRGRDGSLVHSTESLPVSIGRSAPRPRGRPRKEVQPLQITEDIDSDDGLAISVDTDPEETESESDEEEEITSKYYTKNSYEAKHPIGSPEVSQPDAKSPRYMDGPAKVSGLHITIGEGYSVKMPASHGNKGSTNPVAVNTKSKIGPPPPLHPLAATSSTSGIQISVPSLPTTCAMVTKDITPRGSVSPVSLPNAPLSSNEKPAFGVPVPVITSVNLANKQSPVHATSQQSHYLVNNEIDEDYDS